MAHKSQSRSQNQNHAAALKAVHIDKNILAPPSESPKINLDSSDHSFLDISANCPKTLCIGTVIPDCGELSEKWLSLQLKFLKSTTSTGFHHVTFLQKGTPSQFFLQNTEVIQNSISKNFHNSGAHAVGLRNILEYFKKHSDEYENFLFLDMDAFPIRKQWHECLCDKLSKGYEIATILRCENLEQRLHSSVIFLDKRALEYLDWDVREVGKDLLGVTEADVQIANYQQERRNKAFVMLRSNQYQIHPLLCAVYYDLFYHHGNGCGKDNKMKASLYWSHVISQEWDSSKTSEHLFSHPTSFIGKLAGWYKEEYAQV